MPIAVRSKVEGTRMTDQNASGQAANPSKGPHQVLPDATKKDAPFQLLLRFEQDHVYFAKQDPKKSSPVDLIQRTIQTLTLVGLGLYGAIRFGQQLYCDRLGVTPEEIGLTYLASISRAAVILIALFAPAAVFLSLLALNGMIRGTSRPTRAAERMFPVFPALVFLLAFVPIHQQLGDAGVYLVAIASISSILIYALVAYIISRRKRFSFEIRQSDEFTRFFHPHHSFLIVLALVGAIILAGFMLAGFSAVDQASDVQGGRRSEGGKGLGILGLKADRVVLIGNSTEEPSLSKKKLMYLGRSEGKLVLYDVSCQQPLRLADDAITIIAVADFPADAEHKCNPTQPKAS
jgi:hypothetical protein